MATAEELFVNLEIEAWEAPKPPARRNAVSGLFPGDHAVRRGARSAWANVIQQQHLAQAITDWRNAQGSLVAAVNAADTIPAGTSAAIIREDVPAQRAILRLRRTFSTSLHALRHARANEVVGQVDRTVSHLESLQDANRAAVATLETALGPPPTTRAEWNRVASLNDPQVEPPEDAQAFLDLIRRRVQLLGARVAYAARLEDLSDADFSSAHAEQSATLVERFEQLLGVANERAERHKINHEAKLPAADDVEAVAAHRAQVIVALQALTAVDILQKVMIDIRTEELSNSSSDAQRGQLERLQKENETCCMSIAATRKGARRLDSLVRTAQDGTLRLDRGQLGSEWKLINQAGRGGFGTADAWAKQNHFGVIVDRVVIKDTSTCFRGEAGWSGPGKALPSRPLEVDTMYHVQEAKQPGHENVVKILNWRLDPDRDQYEKVKASREHRSWELDCFRIYVEWCGHGDLSQFIQLNPEATIPEPFLWSLFQALANACRAMEGHRLDSESNVTAIVLHNDIKLENIFLGENTSDTYVRWPVAKVGDFGLARWRAQDELPSHADRFRGAGTKCYIAPEQAVSQSKDLQPFWTDDHPNSKSNVWSIGNLMWSVMHGRTGDPRIGYWYTPIPEAGLAPGFSELKRDIYGAELVALIEQCLAYHQQQRISLEDLREELENALDRPQPADQGLKHAGPNDPQWARNLFKIQQDYIQLGFVLHDVRDRSGDKIFPNPAILDPLPRAAAEQPISDDHGEGAGAKLYWEPNKLREKYSFDLNPASPPVEQSEPSTQAPAAANAAPVLNAFGQTIPADADDKSPYGDIPDATSPNYGQDSSEGEDRTGVRGRILGEGASFASPHSTVRRKRTRGTDHVGDDPLRRWKSPRQAWCKRVAREFLLDQVLSCHKVYTTVRESSKQ